MLNADNIITELTKNYNEYVCTVKNDIVNIPFFNTSVNINENTDIIDTENFIFIFDTENDIFIDDDFYTQCKIINKNTNTEYTCIFKFILAQSIIYKCDYDCILYVKE